MAKSANDIRVGNILDYNGGLWKVLKLDHVKPGKGGAFIQAEMKEIKNGTKLNERFRSTETIETAHFENVDMQYLFASDDVVTLMDNNTYEQVEVSTELFNGNDIFLQDGMTVTLEQVQEQYIAAKVPNHITVKIAETEPVVKGQTAASSNKPATLENGVKIMVPPFVNADDNIVINTEDRTYISRD